MYFQWAILQRCHCALIRAMHFFFVLHFCVMHFFKYWCTFCHSFCDRCLQFVLLCLHAQVSCGHVLYTNYHHPRLLILNQHSLNWQWYIWVQTDQQYRLGKKAATCSKIATLLSTFVQSGAELLVRSARLYFKLETNYTLTQPRAVRRQRNVEFAASLITWGILLESEGEVCWSNHWQGKGRARQGEDAPGIEKLAAYLNTVSFLGIAMLFVCAEGAEIKCGWGDTGLGIGIATESLKRLNQLFIFCSL